MTDLSKLIHYSYMGSRRHFSLEIDHEPKSHTISEYQTAAGYSPMGYGAPTNVELAENEDGSWTATWTCAGSC